MDRVGHATAWATGEVASVAMIFGAVAHLLPSVATLLAIVWYVLCIVNWFRPRPTKPPE